MKKSTKVFWAGVLTFALGLVVILNAAVASGAIVIVTGLILLIGGAAQTGLYFMEGKAERKWGSLAIGILTLLLGWSFIANPLSGVISLTTLILVLFAVSGVLQIILGIRERGTPLFWPLLIAGIIPLVLAGVVLSSPAATMLLLGTLLGVHMLASGTSLILLGKYMKQAGVQTVR
ncbi:HdeD family acid-resistance protein [Marinobacterium lutimaris]|uniref:Uncharacterized membrane protein HdeD, DUF308 family n=1 Tax=Marinobacterium lutimaris TaxID=568106 RepID=A0A1H6C3F6_9GAMM|nr:DUF308 domain-containing protein [Marinobacterium lutimaris]SEG67468.1 Uncharacterized membrane protein HdeD, DUF308 family [Marinobacterium lutimaris]